MKVVKTKEDIKGPMWCKATEENFNYLQKIGISCWHNNYKSLCNEPNYLDSDVFCFTDGSKNDYAVWSYYEDRKGEEFMFEESAINNFGFLIPETFEAEIFKVYVSKDTTEYIGVVNKNIPAKWLADGTCVNPSSGYTLYKEYKQRIYTKPNSPGLYPKQKFKISWTNNMSIGLEQSGWRLATNDEIEGFKNV
jgi:hypothetical protein